MQGNKARDTRPELAVRKALHAAGLRYRVDFRPNPSIRSRADVVFTRLKIAVYIDGCYWHGCPLHYTAPKANAEFWRNKVTTNRHRDTQTTAELEALGWDVLRFWTHEDVMTVTSTIISKVRPPDTGER